MNDEGSGSIKHQSDGKVKVAVRIKPVSAKEKARVIGEPSHTVINYSDTKRLVIETSDSLRAFEGVPDPLAEGRSGVSAVRSPRSARLTPRRKRGNATKSTYSFDRVFSSSTTQLEIYQEIGESLVERALEGYNGTILAYGQTGTGKTFTMQGDLCGSASGSYRSVVDSSGIRKASPTTTKKMAQRKKDRVGAVREMRGLIPRVIERIFERISEAREDIEFCVTVSFVEIYLEGIRDLLAGEASIDLLPGVKLQIREDPTKGVYVDGMIEKLVETSDAALQLLSKGSATRATAATGMNEGSSRSHSVFTLHIIKKDRIEHHTIQSKVTLVDLAGSEKITRTHAEGERLEEAKMINKSLAALGNVIKALTDDTVSHVPYRDSKLTRMLQQSLGGNAKTWLVINLSSLLENLSESMNSLRFGMRASQIQNAAVVNQIKSVEELEILLKNAERALDHQAHYIKKLKRRCTSFEQPDSVQEDEQSSAQRVQGKATGPKARQRVLEARVRTLEAEKVSILAKLNDYVDEIERLKDMLASSNCKSREVFRSRRQNKITPDQSQSKKSAGDGLESSKGSEKDTAFQEQLKQRTESKALSSLEQNTKKELKSKAKCFGLGRLLG